MQLSGTDLKAAREYTTILTGDRQEFKRMIARAQDNPRDLLGLITTHVTEVEAERSPIVKNVIKALEAHGFGDTIRFKPEPPPPLTKKDIIKSAVNQLKQKPFFDILARKGLVTAVLQHA